MGRKEGIRLFSWHLGEVIGMGRDHFGRMMEETTISSVVLRTSGDLRNGHENSKNRRQCEGVLNSVQLEWKVIRHKVCTCLVAADILYAQWVILSMSPVGVTHMPCLSPCLQEGPDHSLLSSGI